MNRTVAWLALCAACIPASDDTLEIVDGGRLAGRVDRSGARLVTAGEEVVIRAVAFGTAADRAPLRVDASFRRDDGDGGRLELWSGPLVEWWRDLGGALEHGFDVARAPRGDGALRIELAVEGARVEARGRDLRLVTPSGASFAYEGLSVVDARGAGLPASMAPIGGGLVIEVDVTGAAWPITVDPTLVPADLTITAGEDTQGYDADDLDANGDGVADLLVSGQGSTGTVELYLGSAAGLSGTSAWSSGVLGTLLFDSSGLGDVNGDGYDDLAVATSGARTYEIRVHHGSSNGPSAAPTGVITGPVPAPTTVDGVGDVNGDGFDDVLVGANTGLALFLGSPRGLVTPPAWTDARPALGQHLAGVGDVNGDGYDDFVSTRGAAGWGSDLELYLGGPAGPTGVFRTWLGDGGAGPGDVDGDGYADIAVAEDTRLVLYRGGPGGPGQNPTSTLDYVANWGVLAGIADGDGDGRGDVVTGDSDYDSHAGHATVVYGSAAGLLTPAQTIGRAPGDPFTEDLCGISVASGDWDADGFADVAVGCPGDVAHVAVHYGAPDADRDGDPDATDCDDGDPAIHRGATDTWYDGVDTNCDGWDDYDSDYDRQRAAAYGGDDCDDRRQDLRGCTELTGTCPGPMELHVRGLTPSSSACLVVGTRDRSHDLGPGNNCAPGEELYTEVGGVQRVMRVRADAAGTVDASGALNTYCGSRLQVLDLRVGTRTPTVTIP